MEAKPFQWNWSKSYNQVQKVQWKRRKESSYLKFCAVSNIVFILFMVYITALFLIPLNNRVLSGQRIAKDG